MATAPSNQQLRRGLLLFKIAGIQIRLDFSWFLICILVRVSLSTGYFPRLRAPCWHGKRSRWPRSRGGGAGTDASGYCWRTPQCRILCLT
jgi:hypothetical protein